MKIGIQDVCTRLRDVSQVAVTHLRPDRVFLLLGAGFGLLLAIVTLPGEPPDEPYHFYRAFQVSEGRFVSEVEWTYDAASGEPTSARVGGRLPKSLYDFNQEWAFGEFPVDPTNKPSLDRLRGFMFRPLNSGDRTFIAFFQARYPFLVYVPQAVGIAIARIFDPSAVLLLYAGRVGNLVVWLILVYAAVRIAPAGRWLLLVLALMPMSVRLAASLSADTLTNALSLLLIAVVLRASQNREARISLKETTALTLVAALLCTSKQAYFLLAFLFFLIPRSRFPTRRAYFYSVAGFFSVCGLSCIAALMLAKSASAGSDLDSSIQFIIDNPLAYAGILLRGIVWKAVETPYLFETFVGLQGWREPVILLPTWLLTSYFIVLYLVSLSGIDSTLRLGGPQRGLLLALFAASIPVIFTLAYLSWSPAGGPGFTVHGRMFVPIAPLLLLSLSRGASPRLALGGLLRACITGYVTICLAVTFSTIVREFYVPTANLIRNGDFAEWQGNVQIPSGWECEAPSSLWSTAPIVVEGWNPAIAQTWITSDSAAATNRSFGCFVNGLKPHTRYRLYVRARNLSRCQVIISAWEMEGEYLGPDAPYPTPKQRLGLLAAVIPPGPGGSFAGRAGEFYTREGGCVRLFARLSDGSNALPATVQWDLWALTEMNSGLPWRRFSQQGR